MTQHSSTNGQASRDSRIPAEAMGSKPSKQAKGGKGKPRSSASTKPAPTLRASSRRFLCIGMGTGIPLLSLSLSSIGGRLVADGHVALGTAALGLCCAVLAVSLSHLAWAVGDITRSSRWQSWSLAIVVDVALVLCELACVAGASWWLVQTVMASVTASSAFLNCWAFLRHR